MHPVYLTYDWLVANNLWKDVVQIIMAAVVGWLAARVPLRKYKKQRAEDKADVMDKLDTRTPGGLGDIATILERNEGTSEADRPAT